MKISVITACYNTEATISRTIESFLEQDHPDRELIVIDGASKDGTCDVVRRYQSPLIRLYSEPDKGIYDAMNKGLARVTGDAFGCLNADDRYHSPHALSQVAAALRDVDIVSGRLHFVRAHDGRPPARVWQPATFRKGGYRLGYSLPHPSTYARRAVLDRVGMFSTRYRSASDYDWLLRALEIEGFRHGVIPDVIVDMLIGGESTAGLRSILNNSRELLAVRQERLGSGRIDAALFLNLLRKMGQVATARIFGN